MSFDGCSIDLIHKLWKETIGLFPAHPHQTEISAFRTLCKLFDVPLTTYLAMAQIIRIEIASQTGV